MLRSFHNCKAIIQTLMVPIAAAVPITLAAHTTGALVS
jgi:hypothetical protein